MAGIFRLRCPFASRAATSLRMTTLLGHTRSMPSNDEQQIIKLFEDGDRALISADVDELRRIYADDYLQYDESGNVTAKDDLIRRLTSGAIRFVSMTSTGR